jgi:hypothetical protein
MCGERKRTPHDPLWASCSMVFVFYQRHITGCLPIKMLAVAHRHYLQVVFYHRAHADVCVHVHA